MWTMFRRNERMKTSDSERLKQLEFDFSELRTDFERLNTKHEKLSGRFYARFGKGEQLPQRPTRDFATGDDVLAHFRYIPGRPAPHSNE